MKAKFKELKNNGYYMRPCVFSNTTIYQLTRNEGEGFRSTFCEVSKPTGERLIKMFGFEKSEPVNYFGKCEPVKIGFKRTFYAN